MKTPSVVVLYGKSLPLAGLETCLRALPGLTVVPMGHDAADVEGDIRRLRPEAIIFDSLAPENRNWPPLARMLRDLPQTVLIGYDANSDDLVVVTGHRHNSSTVDDVLAAIRGRGQGS